MSWVMVAMAGAGVAKSEFVDRPKEERQRKLAATTQRLSPWTGLKANPIEEADPVGSALAFGTTGAQLKQGMANADSQNRMRDAYSGWLENGSSPWAAARGPVGATGPSVEESFKMPEFGSSATAAPHSSLFGADPDQVAPASSTTLPANRRSDSLLAGGPNAAPWTFYRNPQGPFGPQGGAAEQSAPTPNHTGLYTWS